MSWWLALLLGYLVVGWSIAVGSRILCHLAGDDEPESPAAAALQRHNRLAYGAVAALTMFLTGPLLPLLAPIFLWNAWQSARQWRKFGRTHREVLMEPTHPANVPIAGQEHFDLCSPRLTSLGFTPAGTYLYKPEPVPIHLHCLVSAAGETVADLMFMESVSLSFVSVLENGHVLETSCSADPLSEDEIEAINRSGIFTSQMFQGGFDADTIAATYRRHLELLFDLERRLGCGTLHLAADQVPALKRYENGVFGQMLHARGKLDNPPQPPKPPTGVAKRVSQAMARAAGACILPAPVETAAPLSAPLV